MPSISDNHYQAEAQEFAKSILDLLRKSEILQAKEKANGMLIKIKNEELNYDGKSMALIIYYIVKVMKKFEDFHVLTHQIYPIIEDQISKNMMNLKN
jgi:hypothetical protein